MPKHAILSASGAARWLTCTPSAQLELQFPKSTSTYAQEGTDAHTVAELTARYWLGEIPEKAFENELANISVSSQYYNAEMREHAADYARLIHQKVEDARQRSSDALVELESRLDFSDWVPEGFGTGDCVIVADGVLEIVDYKYGKGHRVEAAENPQMRLYALGALARYGQLYDIHTVRTTIFQPRISGVQSDDEISVTDLLAWAEGYVRPRAKMADKGEGDFAPSDEACKFCRAKEVCRARADYNLSLFDDAPDLVLLTVEEAAAILAKAADMKAWLSDLENLVSSELFKGESVEGWKLVEGRSNRKFADEKKVAKALRAAGFTDKQIYKKDLIPLTQMEKEFGKKTVADILSDLVVKPAGKPTLAPASDKRPAYTSEEQVLAAFDEKA